MDKEEIANCIIEFNNIIPGKNLRKNGLTLSEYLEIEEILFNFTLGENGETKSNHVYKWFMKHGAKSVPHGIGWYIYF